MSKPHAFFGPDAKIIIKDSQFKNCYHGIYAFLDHSWIIQNNRIENSVMGIVLLASTAMGVSWEGPAGKSYVKNNWIQFNGAMGMGIQYVKNVEVKDNVISGSGNYGGIVCLAGDNWIIKDNDLCGVSSKPLFLISLKNSEIKDNLNQVIAGAGAADPSNTIGEGRECN